MGNRHLIRFFSFSFIKKEKVAEKKKAGVIISSILMKNFQKQGTK